MQLVGTAHGNTLENLIKNPTITDLIGGIQYVTLGDKEAKLRGSSKSILERKAPPTFDVAIEISYPNTWAIHDNIEQSVDFLLQGQNFLIQRRSLIKNKEPGNTVDCTIFYNQKESDIIRKPSLNFSGTEKKKKNNYFLNRCKNAETAKYKKSIKNTDDIKKNLHFYMYMG